MFRVYFALFSGEELIQGIVVVIIPIAVKGMANV